MDPSKYQTGLVLLNINETKWPTNQTVNSSRRNWNVNTTVLPELLLTIHLALVVHICNLATLPSKRLKRVWSKRDSDMLPLNWSELNPLWLVQSKPWREIQAILTLYKNIYDDKNAIYSTALTGIHRSKIHIYNLLTVRLMWILNKIQGQHFIDIIMIKKG